MEIFVNKYKVKIMKYTQTEFNSYLSVTCLGIEKWFPSDDKETIAWWIKDQTYTYMIDHPKYHGCIKCWFGMKYALCLMNKRGADRCHCDCVIISAKNYFNTCVRQKVTEQKIYLQPSGTSFNVKMFPKRNVDLMTYF